VTLDNCSLAPVADKPAANPQQEIQITQQDIPIAANRPLLEEVIKTVPQIDAPRDYAPLPNPKLPRPVTRTAKEQATPPPPAAPSSPSPAPPAPSLSPLSSLPPDPVEQQGQTVKKNSDSSSQVPYKLYVLLVLGGAVGYFILSKLLSLTVRAMRSPAYPTTVITNDDRKAALEALLLKSSKKK
jgi:hypothetical protein